MLQLCHEAGQPVVPWGGCTGLVEGARADGAIALSLQRMNRIEEIDAAGATMTVEAGCVLQTVCEAAEAKGLFFPLDLGARGSATIGGNISTNAGGNRVLRYGMMRELVLGLEVVLADGTVMSLPQSSHQEQCRLRSEAACSSARKARSASSPAPCCGCGQSPPARTWRCWRSTNLRICRKLLRNLERGFGGTLSAFEVMWADFYKLVTTPPAKGQPADCRTATPTTC